MFRKQGHSIQTLDMPELLHLLRIDINGLGFAFTGGFSHGPACLDDAPHSLLQSYNVIIHQDVSDKVDNLIVGERRAKGKTATLRKADALIKAGHKLNIIPEQDFLNLLSILKVASDDMDMAELIVRLRAVVDHRRIDRAIKMLKEEAFELYADVTDTMLTGIVKSQTGDGTYYAPWLEKTGRYGCCSDDVFSCMGLQGQICKHILVLLIGLMANGKLNALTALSWATEGSKNKPSDDEDPAAQMLLKYKSVEAGEIDWRPTETVPEDYYLL
jgi:hypothetical protein